MTGMLPFRVIGTSPERADGRAKVTGTAAYALDQLVGPRAHVHPLQATIARGRITGFATDGAEALPGVLAVLTHENAPTLASTEDAELAILQSGDIGFRGQLVGAVIAETAEIARQAAGLVRIDYETQPHKTTLDVGDPELYAPDEVNAGHETDTEEGDLDAALRAAEVALDETYKTAWYNNNPIEPHATLARFADGELTLYDSTQGVHSVRKGLSTVLGLGADHIRVISPHVGGGFGAKGNPHAHLVLAAMAAQALPGRWVALPLSRHQMFTLVGYRVPTIQRVRLAADRDGKLLGLGMDVVEQTSRVKEYAEQTAVPARMMYAATNRRTSHRLVPLDVPVPSWMRAPGECPGMFGPEVAMDELAVACGVDPVELRIRNEPERDPETGNPFSSRHLVECLREGARRFGWAGRDPMPRERLENGWLVGTGVASSVYPAMRKTGSTARIRFELGRYFVEIGAADIGTGTWTALRQIAADALDVGYEDVELDIGDTALPEATVAGGSSGLSSWGVTVVEAATVFRDKFGTEPADGDEAEASTPSNPDARNYAMYAFGAQFAEVRIHADTGEVRVPRMTGVFAAGTIVNPRTARSQFLGGMTMGLSMALHEQSVFDDRFGHVVTHDLSEYHIATNADVPALDVHWLDEVDPYVNPMGTKGIGEIGIVGTAAAIANAAYHATGVRIRELPITLDHFLG
jgi:xanthine dehydrogenase YagR molybdenum-binding subunit